MKLKALQKKQSSRYSYVFPALLVALSAIAIGGYNAAQQTSPPLPTHNDNPHDNQAFLALEERLKALEDDTLGNMRGVDDTVASMKTQLENNCNAQIETALTELRRELQLKIDALQQSLDTSNRQLEQYMTIYIK